MHHLVVKLVIYVNKWARNCTHCSIGCKHCRLISGARLLEHYKNDDPDKIKDVKLFNASYCVTKIKIGRCAAD